MSDTALDSIGADMSNKTPAELMNIYATVLRALNDKRVVRTYNSPVGDYAEWLVKCTLGLELEGNSKKGYDAIDPQTGLRYQIKSRWERGEPTQGSRELNVIRDYDEKQFDFLIVVIFGTGFEVKEAYKIPHETVGKYAFPHAHMNGCVVIAKGNILTDKDTCNITGLFNQ